MNIKAEDLVPDSFSLEWLAMPRSMLGNIRLKAFITRHPNPRRPYIYADIFCGLRRSSGTAFENLETSRDLDVVERQKISREYVHTWS